MRIISNEMAEAIQKIVNVPGVDKATVEKLVLLSCECGYDQAKRDWERYNIHAVETISRIIQ